jgi:uncharacterized protein DUF1553/uncharacterized protein DUF1549/cytochrome c
MGLTRQHILAICAVTAVAMSGGLFAAAPAIDFNREIRPILSDNCFKCHGPDENERKAKLRFDRKEDAFQPAKSGELAIVPGQPEKSALIARINSTDPDDIMPPPKTGKKLTQQQKDLLTRWIAGGAQWQEHWAFETPKQPDLPNVKKKNWPENEIDYFVLARLEKEGLKPSPDADKTTLVRRATLDLTGLPPTPEEVDAYLADKSPEAYDKLVERLLNSPRYGEHMARYWLDAARYADSHGYHIDSERSMWKWRDWVVNAFNQNMPFDQFTVEQLAGDLLPEPTMDQKVASGYVRCNMSTGEGGAIDAEYQAKYTFDRVETSATIWMGLTLTCARCHTHKYDPIAHKEYYGLYSFFNNIDESVMDGNKPNPDPFIKLPTPEQRAQLDRLKEYIGDGQKKLDAPMPELDEEQEAWQRKWHEKLSEGWSIIRPQEVKSTNGTTFVIEDETVLAEGENPESDIHELTFKLEPATIAALRLDALPHKSLPRNSSARSEDGRFRLSEFEAELVTPGDEDKPKVKKLKFSQAVADASEANYEIDKAIDGKAETGWGVAGDSVTNLHSALFLLADPVKVQTNSEFRVRLRYEASKSKRAIGHFRIAAAQNENLVRLLNPPKLAPWQVIGPFKAEDSLAALNKEYEPDKEIDLKKSYSGVREEIKWSAKNDFDDGKANLLVNELHGVHGVYYLYRVLTVPEPQKLKISLQADDLFRIWLNGKVIGERKQKAKSDEGALKFTVDLQKGENKFLVKVVNHVGACYFTFNHDLNQADSVPADLAAILATAEKASGSNQQKVRNYFRRLKSPEFKDLFEQVNDWREEETAIDKTIPTTMVAKEMDKLRETFMLVRGEYDKKGDKVPATVPAILPPFPKDAPTNRLGLAKWLLDPNHPLTARVTVNRFWQQYFGVGLVKTAEDFGVQGERPSHPELLDWLATEFLRSGWDVRRLQKLIVTSRTYRQSSRVTPELIARDPENRLLARGPRFRLDGEVVRDSALAVGGLLVDKQGGRAVKPYEPPGLWEAVSFNNSQKYVPDKGEGQHRRSLYTYWKRQSPPPNMLIFDAPTREYCVVRRPRTNTPLQALVTLNDPHFVEAARGLAERIIQESADPEKRVIRAFRLALGRAPKAEEIKVLLGTYNQQLADFEKDPAAAEKLSASTAAEKAELAAWTTIASMIMNLDEFLTKG